VQDKTEERGLRNEEGGIREEDGGRRMEDSRQDLRTKFRAATESWACGRIWPCIGMYVRRVPAGVKRMR